MNTMGDLGDGAGARFHGVDALVFEQLVTHLHVALRLTVLLFESFINFWNSFQTHPEACVLPELLVAAVEQVHFREVQVRIALLVGLAIECTQFPVAKQFLGKEKRKNRKS